LVEDVREMSPAAQAAIIGGIAGGAVGGVFTLLGVAVGLLGERWVRSLGKVRCNIDSWAAWTSGGEVEERRIEVTFLNEKDLNAVVWDIRVEFHKQGQDPLRPNITFVDEVSRWWPMSAVNLPSRVAVSRSIKVELSGYDLQAAKEADRAEFVAIILPGVGEKREELRPPWH
jgi:hypothetical protein